MSANDKQQSQGFVGGMGNLVGGVVDTTGKVAGGLASTVGSTVETVGKGAGDATKQVGGLVQDSTNTVSGTMRKDEAAGGK